MKLWIKRIFLVLGLIAFGVLIWFAGPLIGFGDARPLEGVWTRAIILSVTYLGVAIYYLTRWLLRRRRARALEADLTMSVPDGDGEVLAEKMKDALATLKQSSGGKSYLYDLPWYVIIGPPGSGKTTALLNSEIKFPLADANQAHMSGFGGTRYCDWWFAEDAIMIDTAGRYTTQDSDATQDSASWTSFLELLKRNRPKQPVNGVMIAFSVEDLITSTPDQLSQHAEAIRARLGEIHETLKIDFPVYVLFTKADLISGFREYFASFSASRRRKVWGATFQTKSKKEQTVNRVPEEFDLLVSRLSDEVVDRLSEEPDGISRIAIFGLPGQMAMLRDKVSHLLGQVFEPTRYKTSATLRGFYFTSGTQEGTPIDQVLGAMGAGNAALMSGKGKSFFLHDLLSKVIFAEDGWVGYDRNAVRRATGLRLAGFVALGALSLGLLGAWGLSYFQNRELVKSAEAAVANYELAAQGELTAIEIADTDLSQISSHLNMLRDMPAGYGEAQGEVDGGIAEGFGLSVRSEIEAASQVSYQDALERMLRTRLVLLVEEQLAEFVSTNQPLPTYETLKAYKLLGGVAPRPQDDLIKVWFQRHWADVQFPGPNNRELREDLASHLDAMLEMDGKRRRSPEEAAKVALNADLIASAEVTLARMPVAEQAYSLIVATAPFAALEDFNVAYRAGIDATVVFETVDGAALDEQIVPGLYTYQGFHEFFLDQLAEVAKKLQEEQWVLGEQAAAADIDSQLARLGPQLLARYREDYIKSWDGVLANVKLAPMAADKPVYRALSAASSPATSPIKNLAEAIASETRLTAEPPSDGEDGLGIPGAEGAGAAGGILADRIRNRTSGLQRIGLDMVMAGNKSQRRAGAAGQGGVSVPGASIEAYFQDYHFLVDGDPGQRPIDGLIANLGALHQSLVIGAGVNGSAAAAQMTGQIGQLRTMASRLPPAMENMVYEVVQDLEGDAANTEIGQLNEALTVQVTRVCEDIISNRYPFSNSPARQVPMAEFGRLFAPGGVIDIFFNQNLARHADLTGDQWVWRADSPVGDRLSVGTLRQFQRAAAIRDAFFAGQGTMPNVQMSVIMSSSHNRVRTAVLEANGTVIKMDRKGNVPAVLDWPGAGGSSTSLQLLPALNKRDGQLAFQGPWAFYQFVRSGRPQTVGDVVQVRYTVGGRDVAYDIRVNALANPFTMRELSEFRCPSGL